jgi:hypothetical protein
MSVMVGHRLARVQLDDLALSAVVGLLVVGDPLLGADSVSSVFTASAILIVGTGKNDYRSTMLRYMSTWYLLVSVEVLFYRFIRNIEMSRYISERNILNSINCHHVTMSPCLHFSTKQTIKNAEQMPN